MLSIANHPRFTRALRRTGCSFATYRRLRRIAYVLSAQGFDPGSVTTTSPQSSSYGSPIPNGPDPSGQGKRLFMTIGIILIGLSLGIGLAAFLLLDDSPVVKWAVVGMAIATTALVSFGIYFLRKN